MQPATHIDGIRHASASRTLNVVRADTVKAGSLSQSMDLMGATMAYPRNSEIFGEGEPAEYLYKVDERQRAHLQDSARWTSPGWWILSAGRYFRSRIC